MTLRNTDLRKKAALQRAGNLQKFGHRQDAESAALAAAKTPAISIHDAYDPKHVAYKVLKAMPKDYTSVDEVVPIIAANLEDPPSDAEILTLMRDLSRLRLVDCELRGKSGNKLQHWRRK